MRGKPETGIRRTPDGGVTVTRRHRRWDTRVRKHHTVDEGQGANGEPITCSDGLTATVTATGPSALRVATKGTAITDGGIHFDANLKRE